MVQFFLLIILVCTCAIVYLFNDRDPLSPAFLFTIGFALCAFSTVFFSERWAYEMSAEVFFVVVGGVLTFAVVSFVCLLANRQREARRQRQGKGCNERQWMLPVNKGLLVAFVVFEGIVLYWSMVVIIDTYPAENISRSIGLYNSAVKFTDEGADIFRTPLSQMRSISSMLGYVFAFYVAQSFALSKKEGRGVQMLGLLLACLLQLASANRTVAVGYIFCFVIAYFILKRKLENDSPVIGVRMVFVLICVAVLFIASFQTIAEVVQGRTTSSDSLGYLSAYIGAQLPNLDTFIQSGDVHEDSGIFGYMTFRNSIRWIGLQFAIPEFVYQYDLPFNTINGVSTGNVYTTFYAFLYDFGIAGCILLTGLMAAFSQLVYQKSKALDSGFYSGLWVILYTMVAYALILCFFSNKFYENIFTISMIYRIIYLVVIFWVIKYFSQRETKTDAHMVGRRDLWRA